jgi:hypothetical protein
MRFVLQCVGVVLGTAVVVIGYALMVVALFVL